MDGKESTEEEMQILQQKIQTMKSYTRNFQKNMFWSMLLGKYVTRRRTEAGGPSGATGLDSTCRRKHANMPFEESGPCAGPRIGIDSNAQRAKFSDLQLRFQREKIGR